MPLTPKRPLEETTKAGPEKKKLIQSKLSFGLRATASASSALLSGPSSNRYSSSSSSSASPSNRYPPSAPSSVPTSVPTASRYFSNSSPSGTPKRQSPVGPSGTFKNRQWVRQDSGGSSSLSALSLSEKDKDKEKKGETEGLNEQEDRPWKQRPYASRYNMELAAVAKETM